MQFSTHGPWMTDGPETDVVMSCRVRLARNFAGFPFVARASNPQRREILNVVRQVVEAAELAEEMIWVDLAQATQRDRQLLVERHLISR